MEYTASARYAAAPIDPAMEIRQAREMTVGPFGALYQAWEWEGIRGENFVFARDDVLHLTDKELKDMVRSVPLYRKRSELTVIRDLQGCVVVSFNFLIFGHC